MQERSKELHEIAKSELKNGPLWYDEGLSSIKTWLIFQATKVVDWYLNKIRTNKILR